MGGIKNRLGKLIYEPPFRKRRQMKSDRISIGGFDRVSKFTKYTSIACLTLAILSTLILNIVSSYSSSNIESNAEPVGDVSTLANIDPASISISISSYPSSSSTGGNNPNLSLSIPQGGGIATGRHTVTVRTGSSVIGYELQLSSNSDETGLVNNEDTNADASANAIPTTTGTITNPSQLADKTYGYTLSNIDSSNGGNSNLVNTNIWLGLQPKDNPATIATVDDTDNILTIGQSNEATHNIYYGVNIQNPVGTRAGDYTRQVVYTVVGELMPEPTVEDLVLNSSWTDTTPDTAYGSTSILTGQNLSGVTGVYIDLNDNETKDSGEEVTNLAHGTGDEASTKLTFTAPTYTQEGQKNVYLEWAGGNSVKIENGWNYVESSKCISGTVNTDCQVDIDPGMFAVRYAGDSWSLVNPRYIDDVVPGHAGDWYDYSSGQWANAITVRSDFEKGCYEIHDEGDNLNVSLITDPTQCSTGMYTPKDAYSAVQSYWTNQYNMVNFSHSEFTVYDDFILGYWVYIPRYSYEVMRRDAIDLVQQPEDFKIKFETASDAKKVPVEGCSNTNDPKSYRVGCSLNRTYTNTPTDTSTNEVTNTTWATHPAFTWMDEDGNPVELNGIWVGKFETTGSTEEPTVLPNEKHMSLVSGNIGDMYDVAKSMGIEDKNNKYGNTTSTNLPNQNNNHLATSTSHMLKNSEWGAVAYLSASRYGAGVNQVFNNSQYQASYDGNGVPTNGVTGCGPIDKDNVNASGTYTGDDSALGTSAACHGSSNPEYAYNGEIGKLASTTNNVYGVYDMAGGAWEYVMGSYTTNSTQSSTSQFSNAAKPPYVDLYAQSIFDGDQLTNNNLCTWATCGGHALHETKSVQSVSTSNYGSASWGDDFSYFTYSNYQWSKRGGNANDGHAAGLFFSGSSNGYAYADYGFRVILLVN